MTLIELLMFMAVLIVAGTIGAGVAWVIGLLSGQHSSDFIAAGSFIGAAIGFVGIFVLGGWFGKMDKIHAPCRCGKADWDDFESIGSKGFTNVTKCRCGRQYAHPQSGLWYELTDDGQALLFMKRNALGNWTKPSEKDIANNLLQRTQ
jgi:hypothetical protein